MIFAWVLSTINSFCVWYILYIHIKNFRNILFHLDQQHISSFCIFIHFSKLCFNIKYNLLTFIMDTDIFGLIAVIWSCLLLFFPPFVVLIDSWHVWIFLHSSPLWWKGHLSLVLVLEGLVGLHRIIQLQLLQLSWGIDLDYCR